MSKLWFTSHFAKPIKYDLGFNKLEYLRHIVSSGTIKPDPILSLCTELYSYPIFALPDFTKPFLIESDAANTTVGSVFTQEYVSTNPLPF